MTFAETSILLLAWGRAEKKQRSMCAVRAGERGTSLVWGCDDSSNGDKKDREVSYKSDYTGAFITDWEVPIEPKSPGEGPRADFIVDWIN